jgi:hypothetical protein
MGDKFKVAADRYQNLITRNRPIRKKLFLLKKTSC